MDDCMDTAIRFSAGQMTIACYECLEQGRPHSPIHFLNGGSRIRKLTELKDFEIRRDRWGKLDYFYTSKSPYVAH